MAVSALSETMTLRNMRENGVRSLAITCGAVWCNHQAVLDVITFADTHGLHGVWCHWCGCAAKLESASIGGWPAVKEADKIMADDRTTSMGLFNTAEAYRLAATALEQHGVKAGHAEKPVQFLYSHALELYLKALLRTKHSVSAVEKFRHDIRKLVREAESLGLFVTVADRDVFSVMADTDALIEMRYIRTGSKTWWPR